MGRFLGLFKRSRRDVVLTLRSRFERFRHLLEMNNRVLRLIGDANEKLGGEYLFDAQYLRTLDAELSEAVAAVVHDLDDISHSRYPALSQAFARVQAAVHGSVETPRIPTSLPLTVDIQELGTELIDTAGEKMARLGEVRRLGLDVPDGFVITARACQLLLAQPEVGPRVAALKETGAPDPELEALVGAVDIPTKVAKAIKAAIARFPRTARFAVRSSAIGEDGEQSFAGQYLTVLNAPPEQVLHTWRRVVASLLSPRVLDYRRRHGLALDVGTMAVGCLELVPARASGVVYTVDPLKPESGALLVTAALGLGVSVVEGSGNTDQFQITRERPHRIIESRVGTKRDMWVAGGADVQIAAVPAAEAEQPALPESTLVELAEAALRIEKHMRAPQDIEWAVGSNGRLVILQARPLLVPGIASLRAPDHAQLEARYRMLMRNQGEVACRGVGAGRVFVVGPDEKTDGFEPGDVLVTRHASPRLSSLVATASAVVSDLGAVTGHLATIAREYRIPTIVDARDATRCLAPGSTVTIDADEHVIYEGRVEELLWHQLLHGDRYEDAKEFRMLRRMLKYAAPLSLRDPGASDFAPERCRSYHDIIRFAHERALVELERDEGPGVAGTGARLLDLDVPLDLHIIDIGGGTAPASPRGTLARDEITSKPLQLLMEGLLTPGVWATAPADMDLDGFMASATRAGPLTVPGGGAVRTNVAVVSRDYLNLNLRVGYHFNVIDACLGVAPEDNYILFRFVGGVTDTIRRTRRARLLAMILTQYDFRAEQTADLVLARLQAVPRELCENQLRMIGRLIGFSRQLDVFLRDDQVVDRLVQSFVSGVYQVDFGQTE
jgi:pyruvate,water dikinase